MEHSSITRAAEKVNLSPGAISLQLHNLAFELRTDLFVKSGKHLVPTPAAKLLAEKAKLLIRQVREIEQEFENDVHTDARPFHFATGATALIHTLGRPLRQLRKEFPNVSMQVTVSATEEMVAGLLERRFDLALISLPFPTDGLKIMPLYDEELLIIRPAHKEVRGWHVGSMPVPEIERASFLLYPRRSNMRTMMNDFFKDISVNARVIMEADDTEAIKQLVESGFGYSILPELALRNQPRYFQAFRVPERRMIRKQALAMADSAHPRALTWSIAQFLQSALTSAAASRSGSRPQG